MKTKQSSREGEESEAAGDSCNGASRVVRGGTWALRLFTAIAAQLNLLRRSKKRREKTDAEDSGSNDKNTSFFFIFSGFLLVGSGVT